MVHVEQPRIRPRNELVELPLPLDQRPAAQVLVFVGEQVEGGEERPFASEQQIVKVGPAIGTQADDFPVQDGAVGLYAVSDFLGQQAELREDVAAARHERAAMALDMRERAEAVVLQLEQPVRVIERIRDADERHRPPGCMHGSVSAYRYLQNRLKKNMDVLNVLFDPNYLQVY